MPNDPNADASFALASPRRRVSLGGALVLLALLSYCAWWMFFLVRGELPPAPLRAFTGLPAPSTGCTRSLEALLHGDLTTSFLWNPFAVPILVLLAANLFWLANLALRGRPLRLPNTVLSLWVVLLLFAWIAKFILGPQYW